MERASELRTTTVFRVNQSETGTPEGEMETTSSSEEAERVGLGFNAETRAFSSWILHGSRAPWHRVSVGGDGTAQVGLQGAGDDEAMVQPQRRRTRLWTTSVVALRLVCALASAARRGGRSLAGRSWVPPISGSRTRREGEGALARVHLQ